MNNTILIILICLLLYFHFKNNNEIEKFDNQSDLNNALNKNFNIDIESLRNLSSISNKLIQNETTIPGPINMKGPINIDMNIGHPDDPRYDGQIYRADGQTQIAVDDLLRIRDRNNKETGVEIDVRPGVTPMYPNKSLRLSRKGIQFGDSNNDREANSAQISAGAHDADALCFVGMSNANKGNRRIHMWAEGNTNHEGPIILNKGSKVNLSSWGDPNHWIGWTDNHNGPRVTGWGGGSFVTDNDWTIGWADNGTVDIRKKIWVNNRDILGEILDLRNNGVRFDNWAWLNSSGWPHYSGPDRTKFGIGTGGDKGKYGTLTMGGPRKLLPIKFTRR